MRIEKGVLSEFYCDLKKWSVRRFLVEAEGPLLDPTEQGLERKRPLD